MQNKTFFFLSFEEWTPPHVPHSGSLTQTLNTGCVRHYSVLPPLNTSKHIYISNQTPFSKLHYFAVNYYRGGEEVCPQLIVTSD